MKKFFTLVAGALLMIGGVQAQQLENAGFDTVWEECLPDGEHVVGLQPQGWNVSNVYKLVKGELVTQDANRTELEGYSVKMENKFVGFLSIGATAPAYITLGKPWAYGDMQNVGKPEDTSDGGTFGGIPFTERPDAFSVWVKRTHGTEKPMEKASLLFYSWKGSTTSKVTTGLSSSPVVVDMVDREKDILGKITEGVTGNATVVASTEYFIENDITDWQQIVVPIDYKIEDTQVVPEKMNLIFSSSDYYNRSELGKSNILWVDDVRFIYYAKLNSITLDGNVIPGFDEDVFEYQLPYEDRNKKLEAISYGGSLSNVEISEEVGIGRLTKIIKVTCSASNSVVKEYTYKVIFKGLPVSGYQMEDPDSVLAPGITPTLTFVPSGPYWQFDRYIKKGQEKNLANLKLTFYPEEGYMALPDGDMIYLINSATGEQVNIRIVNVPVLIYDTPITEETSTLTAIHVADPEGVLSEDKAPVYTYNGSENTVTYTYYIKQGIDKEALKTLVPTFDCKEDYAWLKEMGGDFTQSGSVFLFYNADYSKSGTSLVVKYEEYTTREPIAEIKETLNYAFDNNSDWVNVEGKYDNPTDWASSNPSGTYLGGKYPVTRAADGDNGYVKLSTLSPGYEKPNALIPNIVSGSMFYGAFKLNAFKPLKSTQFGLPLVGGYVTSVKGQFKYKSGETYYNNYTPAEPNKKDNWSVVVVIYEVASLDETLDGTNIATVTDKTIAMGSFTGAEAADWTDFNCPVYLLNKDKKMEEGKLYKATVVFSSSIDGANYNGSIGSELCLDNLEVTYSTEAPGTDPTSIDNNTIANISIYPNPATTVINVAGAEAGSMYVIRNVAGGMVRSGELSDAQINVSDLAAGVYFLEAGGKTVKFIKK